MMTDQFCAGDRRHRMLPCAPNAISRQVIAEPKDGGQAQREDTVPGEDVLRASSRDLMERPSILWFSASRRANKTSRGRKLRASPYAKDWKKPRSIARKALGRGTLGRWLKFNLVGGIGILVQFFSLFLMKSCFHLHYLLATTVAVETAVLHNFVWHERYTWADRTKTKLRARSRQALKQSLRRLAHFNLTTGAVSIVGNLALMKLLAGMVHLNYLLANALAIAVCSLLNFLVSELWVFGE